MASAKTILIVDDEPDALESAKTALGEIGDVTTLTASDGVTGLEKAQEAKPDLIILDVQMPNRNGFEVFTDLKKDPATRDIPVMMLTGIADKVGIGFSAEDMGEYMGTEPNAYLEKPIDPIELQKTAARLLGL